MIVKQNPPFPFAEGRRSHNNEINETAAEKEKNPTKASKGKRGQASNGERVGGGEECSRPDNNKRKRQVAGKSAEYFFPFFSWLTFFFLSFLFSLPQRPRLGVAAAEYIRKEKRQLGRGKNQFGKNGASGDRIKRKGEGERHQHFDVVVVCGYVGRGRRAKC